MMIVRKSLKELSISKERLGQLNSIRDKDSDYSEIPKLDEDFWKKPIGKSPADFPPMVDTPFAVFGRCGCFSPKVPNVSRLFSEAA